MSKRKHHRFKERKSNSFFNDSPEPSSAPGNPNNYRIITDGSYRPEGNAACAYVIFSDRTNHVVRMERLAYRHSTINAMELMAVNRALDHPGMDHVTIYSDSMYTISCLTLWRHTWVKNNWLNPLNEPVKNKELIQEIGHKLDNLKSFKFVKVKAHTGDPFNSIVDFMASDLTDKMRSDPCIPDGPYG